MKKVFLGALWIGVLIGQGILWGEEPIAPKRERFLLDEGWRFWIGKGETGEKSTATGSTIDPYQTFGSYSKTGWAGGQNQSVSPAGARFDDWAWRRVDLPHDWAVELHFTDQADVGHGCKMIGPEYPITSVAWYRRSFKIPKSDEGRMISLEFDGVYRDCEVYLNGNYLGRNFSGYAPFTFDITPYLHYGKTNSLAVKVNASGFEGWFYEGAGIYRHVWLVKTGDVHIPQWGTYVTSEVQGKNAEVTIRTKIHNDSGKRAQVTVQSRILNAKGVEAARVSTRSSSIDVGVETEVSQSVDLNFARLWSIDDPYLYQLESRLLIDGKEVDQNQTPFGVRTIRFDADQGFFLNGKRTFIKGTCNHQDHAGVGVGIPDRLNEWRLEQLKKMGCNAYRTSHHPPTPEVLDICDRLGILVMDETRAVGATDEALSQLDRMVRRDRNHPSIILWSLGNEEMEILGTETGKKILTKMNQWVKRLDSTRATTIGMNSLWGKGFSEVVDVQGGNYMKSWTGFDDFHQKYPKQPVIGSEEYSATTTRGIYENDEARQYVHGDEMKSLQPNWASTAEEWLKYYQARPFLAGGFAWTGFDYRGEPTPYHRWPSISSHFGIMDTCGFPKDVFYYYQSWWTDKPVLHLLPHWNWKGKEGKLIDVRCDGNADEVELFLNGQSLKRQVMPRNGHLDWQVAYTPGVLVAKGYAEGKQVSEAKVETTGVPYKVRLTPDRRSIRADGEDLSLVTVEVIDDQGHRIPTAGNEVTFEVVGPAKIIGVGNGDPSCHEPDQYFESVPRAANVDEWKVKDFGKKSWDLTNLNAEIKGEGWEEAYFNHERPVLKEQGQRAIYRGEINLTPELLAKTEAVLSLGPIEGKGLVFVEGIQVGKFDSGYVSCVVPPSVLKKEKVTVCVVVTATESYGGMLKGGKMVFRSTEPLPWKRSTFNGLAQVIVKSTKKSGEIHLRARSQDLKGTYVTILSLPTVPRPYIPSDY
ncbi:MAG: beta-galactosidase GalA [Verrucomicrobiota bacterium]